jgi:hypothetical protein
MLRVSFIAVTLLTMLSAAAQPRTDKTLKDLLSQHNDTIFRKVIDNPEQFRVQIIYTQIDRDKDNKPRFTDHYFNYDPKLYFNPASMVKLPLAILSLEKLNSLQKEGVNRNTIIQFLKSEAWQTEMLTDSTAASKLPTIAHLIKRALLISENDPYNRLYQFMGQGDINRQLKEKGYKHSVITRQFLGLTPDQNRYTNAILFLDRQGKEIYRQLAAYNTEPFNFKREIKLGNAHIDREGKLVNEPFDFTMHNNLSLRDMNLMLQAVLFPSSVEKDMRFSLTEDDRRFLLRYLSQYPSETPDPKYDTSQYYDSYVKFFFLNGSRKMPEHVRVFNKVGWSYGFMTDVSYVVDLKNKIEYMLAATIYVNSDGILNDNKYEYEAVGYPFFYQLGQLIHRHELVRQRKNVPDLSDVRIEYEKRAPGDNKGALKDLDN